MKNPFLFIIGLVVICFFTCCIGDKIDDDYEVKDTNGTDLLSFALTTDQGLSFDSFLIDDSVVHVCVPNGNDLSRFSVHTRHNGTSYSLDGKELCNEYLDYSDFTKPHYISVVSSDSVVKSRRINIYDLPVLVIETPDRQAILSKTDKIEGCIITLISAMGIADSLGTASVEGRGNSTWNEPKKPYNIKFDSKQNVLGMGKSKHWVLLANAYWDRTQMHNAVAYKMARLTDYNWVQNGQYVELILNGQHLGLYYLCEKIRVEGGRIDINIMEPSDTIENEMDGGYLLESAFTPGEREFQTDYFNKTHAGKPLYWLIKKPEESLHPSQFSFIRDELNHFEKLLLTPDSLLAGRASEILDIESAINWMLVNEVAVNAETDNPSNLFLYRDKKGKLSFGPPWDFDAHTFGVYRTHQIFLLRDDFYFYWLLQDPLFVKRLKEKWIIYKDIWMTSIPPYIDNLYSQIVRSALRNEQMWPSWHAMYHYPDVDYNTLRVEMKAFFKEQLDYVDSIITNL